MVNGRERKGAFQGKRVFRGRSRAVSFYLIRCDTDSYLGLVSGSELSIPLFADVKFNPNIAGGY